MEATSTEGTPRIADSQTNNSDPMEAWSLVQMMKTLLKRAFHSLGFDLRRYNPATSKAPVL